MAYHKLAYLLYKHSIPESVTMKSDSGWECGPSEMNGVYYNIVENIIIFTQEFSINNSYSEDSNWIKLQ